MASLLEVLLAVNNHRWATKLTKRRRFNDIEICAQLWFAFSDPDGVADSDRQAVTALLVGIKSTMDIKIQDVTLHHHGVEVVLQMGGDVSLSKVVNAFKTQTARALRDHQPGQSVNLWTRGYVARSLGNELLPEEAFALLAHTRGTAPVGEEQ